MRARFPGRRSFAVAVLTIGAICSADLEALAAPTAEQACRKEKNKVASKYASCRQNAEATLATAGDAVKYGESIGKCEEKFAVAWQKAIDKAARADAACLDAPLVADDFKPVIDEYSTNIATALAGGGLASCAEGSQTLPGDGYVNPDAVGVSGHGRALSYADNGDGTFSDCNTGLMWEKKDDSGGVHDVDNDYLWTDFADMDGSDPDGNLFTVFLNTLNNRCDGDEVTACTSDADCAGIGNGLCGHAGHRDWCIPNLKQLQSIVDYSRINPASSVPGETKAFDYWSVTTLAGSPLNVWWVDFSDGVANDDGKIGNGNKARAVRPCL